MSGLQPVIPFSSGRRPVNVAGTALSDVKQSYLLNPTPPTPRAAALATTATASSVPSAAAAFASASASAENDPTFANRSSAPPSRASGAAASSLLSPDRASTSTATASSAAPNQTADGLFEISAERLASIRAQVQRGAREAGERFRIHVHTQTDTTDPTFVEMLQRKVDLLEQVCRSDSQVLQLDSQLPRLFFRTLSVKISCI
jgi:hypothetical protein